MITATLALHMIAPARVYEKQGKNWKAEVRIPALASSQASDLIFGWAKREADKWIKETTGDEIRPDAPYEFSITAGTPFTYGNFLSIQTGLYAYSGGAHPGHSSRVFNLITENGKVRPVRINEFIVKGTDPYVVFTKVIMPVLRERGASWVTEGMYKHFTEVEPKGDTGGTALPVPKVGPKGLTFTFDAYAVGSYAEGDYVVDVPWSRLGSRLNKAFVKKITGR